MTSGDQTPVAGSGRSETAGTDAGTGQAVMAAWQVLGPLIGLVTRMALRVAATLRLGDFMPDDGTGEGTVLGDLAERAGADPEALARMLRHLVQHGVFTEPRPGQFAANQTAALLRTGQPGAVWLDLDGFGGRMDLAFTGLVHTVRTGKPAWEQVSASRSGTGWTPTPRSAPPSTRPWRWTPGTSRWRTATTGRRCGMWPTSAAERDAHRRGAAAQSAAARHAG